MDQKTIDRHIGPLLERGEHVRWRGVSTPGAFIAGRIPHVLIMIGFMLFPLASNGKSLSSILRFDFASLHAFQIIWMAIIGIPLAGTIIAMVRDMSVGWAITDRRIYRITRSSATSTEIAKATSFDVRRRSGGAGTLIVKLPEYRDDDNHLHSPSVDIKGIRDVDGAHAALTAAQRSLRGPQT